MFKVTGKFDKLVSSEDKTSAKGKEYKVVSFTVEYIDGKYTKLMAFTSLNEKAIEVIEGLKTGVVVDVSFDISANEWKGKYYNTMNAFYVSSKEVRQPQTEEGDSDLPF